MQTLLTPEQFALRAVGIPWRKWRSDWSNVDCFGLIVLYHREVFGIDLGPVPETDIAGGFAESFGWCECRAVTGASCFMAWREDAPTHCGILLNEDRVLHAEGSEDHPGSVRVSRLAVIGRVYGAPRFYRYDPC